MNYTPEELVRIELLRYSNPEGLHPVEANWRNLSRRLLQHLERVQELVKSHHDSYHWRGGKSFKDCEICKANGYLINFKFPNAFNPEPEKTE